MLRMTRRLDAGVIKIKDRKKNEKGEFEPVFLVLGVKHSPKQKLYDVEKETVDPKDKKKKIKFKTGEKRGVLDPKTRLPVWASFGETFEVNDEDFVLKDHGGILEKC
jgi:hypothetical protein